MARVISLKDSLQMAFAYLQMIKLTTFQNFNLHWKDESQAFVIVYTNFALY